VGDRRADLHGNGHIGLKMALDPKSDRPRPSSEPEELPEKDPDVRFTYANERTFLAWSRTALALIATGVAATQLLPKFDITWGRRLLGLPLICLGALVAVASFFNWRSNERAMRRGDPLPRSIMPIVLCIGIAVVGLIAIVIAAVGKA
jgi:putative membrane protein